MKLQGRNLVFGMRGDALARVQHELSELGREVPLAER